jgi:two-component system heavy metal sensor histidine kinase CusS
MAARRRWPRLSLTQRLTLFFAVLTSLVVLALGVLVLLDVNQHFVDMDHTALQEKRLLIEGILHDANSVDDARWRLDEALDYHGDLFVLINGSGGPLLYRSSRLGGATLDLAGVKATAGGAFGAVELGSQTFRTLLFKATPAYATAPVTVLIGTGTLVHARFLEELAGGLGFYLFTAMALCAALAWLAAREGLAPLRRMQSRAAAVAASRLDERMPVDSVPPEMAALASELNRMLDRLQADFQRLTGFAADIAHELRTPISNLLAQTQVTLSAPRDVATYRDVLASNVEEFERLARMVSDMLLLAKTEHGVDALRIERFDARAEIQTLFDYFGVLAEEKSLRLRLEGSAPVHADRLMFRRAVSNLLSNAVRHTPAGGEIVVRLAGDARAATVVVENTGPEIPAEVLPHLFERFYRGEGAAARADASGSGLGLAITRAIVEAHGGRAGAVSAQGRTRFSLTFPHPAGAS